MFQIVRHFSQIPTKFVTGSISHGTKVGRLAKLLHCESRQTGRVFDFVALGEELIGKTVKAICMAQEITFPEVAGSDIAIDLCVTPYDFGMPGKIRPVPSVRFIIEPVKEVDKFSSSNEASLSGDIRVGTKTEPSELAKKLHSMYISQGRDVFVLRCMGYSASALVIRAMTIFNQNVSKHKLSATISTELVPDSNKISEGTFRVIIFRIRVVPVELVVPTDRRTS